MKIRNLMVGCVTLLVCLGADAANLRVNINGLKKDQEGRNGILRLAICDAKGCYDTNGQNPPYVNVARSDLPKEITLGDDQTSATFDFNNLPAGTYSVLLHHDRDSDGQVDNHTCFGGAPYDGIGFSNNIDPRKIWRKPHWEEVRFTLPSEGMAIELRPLYMCD